MKARFGIEDDEVTPNELIRALLRAQVELLWLGGIGTYVRSSSEADGAVGDRANDAVRIDATELAAQVVGEGANLGLTQRARIEYALLGGRLNTDAIDNSAGVDCSDHEVNIKILLGAAERDGDLTRKQRNELLELMTDEVGELVLRDNYLQTQSISVTHQLGAHLLDRLGRFMRRLAKDRRLDRKLEFLPDDEELAERAVKGIGLTRPELCVLLSYAKMELYDQLLASDLPDDPTLAVDLANYFPRPIREHFPDRIANHGLRREIIATIVTNEMINRVGITFAHEVHETTGFEAAEIARAYLIARTIFRLPGRWEEIEALDNQAPAAVQASLLVECGRLLERGTVWLLRHGAHPLDVAHELETFGEAALEIADNLDDLLEDDQRRVVDARKKAFLDQGAPEELAHRVASLRYLSATCDIVRLAQAAEQPVIQVARSYYMIGARFGFNWLRRVASSLPGDTAWEKLAVTALVEDLDANQIRLTERVIDGPGAALAPVDAIDAWVGTRQSMVARAEQLLAELQSHPNVDLAMLAVASRQLKATIG